MFGLDDINHEEKENEKENENEDEDKIEREFEKGIDIKIQADKINDMELVSNPKISVSSIKEKNQIKFVDFDDK